jgi:hypothetical protein
MDLPQHPNRIAIVEQIESLELENVLLADGHDHAILGLVELPNNKFVVAYSEKMIIQGLVDDGMEWDEAIEYYNFNIKGAYVGVGTPVYIEDLFF